MLNWQQFSIILFLNIVFMTSPSSKALIGSNIIRLEATDSTNNYANLLLSGQSSIADGTVIWAKHQTAGRGQRGNSWESQTGMNLTFSIILYPGFLKVWEQFSLSRVVALSVADFIGNFIGGVRVKWPNDIFVGDRKIGGILIENVVEQDYIRHSIVGIGININQRNFSYSQAVSLAMLCAGEYDLEQCLCQVCESLNDWYKLLSERNFEAIENAYLSKLYRFDEVSEYCANGKNFRARIVNVKPGGELQLELENGVISEYGFKEVEFII
jgi:BirA family transcriptional regulator, biotin operon repressor / biotin---[acetyl-CoA-carboxylase] ligase